MNSGFKTSTPGSKSQAVSLGNDHLQCLRAPSEWKINEEDERVCALRIAVIWPVIVKQEKVSFPGKMTGGHCLSHSSWAGPNHTPIVNPAAHTKTLPSSKVGSWQPRSRWPWCVEHGPHGKICEVLEFTAYNRYHLLYKVQQVPPLEAQFPHL